MWASSRKNREPSIRDQVSALNVGFMERLPYYSITFKDFNAVHAPTGEYKPSRRAGPLYSGPGQEKYGLDMLNNLVPA